MVSLTCFSGLEPDGAGARGPPLAQPVLPAIGRELGAPHVPLGPGPRLPFLHLSPWPVLPPDVPPLQNQNGSRGSLNQGVGRVAGLGADC